MKNPIIRTIYLYLFALIGLGMLVIGTSMIINLGLKTWIFTKADMQESYYERLAPVDIDKDLELKNIDQPIQPVKELRDPNFYTERNRQRQASTAFSLILVGLPLWLFHWAVIKKDVKKRKED